MIGCPIKIDVAYMKFEHQISEGTYRTKGLRQKDSIVFIVQRLSCNINNISHRVCQQGLSWGGGLGGEGGKTSAITLLFFNTLVLVAF